MRARGHPSRRAQARAPQDEGTRLLRVERQRPLAGQCERAQYFQTNSGSVAAHTGMTVAACDAVAMRAVAQPVASDAVAAPDAVTNARPHANTETRAHPRTIVTRSVAVDRGSLHIGTVVIVVGGVGVAAAVIAVIGAGVAVGAPSRHSTFLIGRQRREIAGTGIGWALIDVVILRRQFGEPFIGDAAAAATTAATGITAGI